MWSNSYKYTHVKLDLKEENKVSDDEAIDGFPYEGFYMVYIPIDTNCLHFS